MLNIEFLWSQNLPHVDPVAGPAKFITPDYVMKSLKRMKNGRAARPTGIVAEMLKAAPDICCKVIADFMLSCIRERFQQIGVTASLLVYLNEKEMP